MSRRLKRRKITAFEPEYFYVDATLGSDANRGKTASDAWQTIAKVNAYTFDAGDYILFKRGETWAGTALTPPQDNLSFGAYGAGAKPIIDGNDAVNCVNANGRSNLVFKDLDLTQGVDAGFNFITCSYISVIDCDAHDAGNDCLLFITGCHHCTVRGGDFYVAYERVGGVISTGIEIADDCHDIEVYGATCRNNIGTLGVGMSIHSHALTAIPYNITIDNCTFHTNTTNGIQVLEQNNAADADRNIVIKNCTTHTNTHDGIRIYKSGGATTYPIGVDFYGNYSHSNTRYAFWLEGDTLLVRNNRLRGRGYINASVGTNFWNNTMYLEVGGGLYPLYIQGARTAGIDVKNNITDATLAGGMMIGVDAAVVGAIDIDYNLYFLEAENVNATRWHWQGVAKNWANWLLDSAQDANSPAADQDPLFVNPGTDFTLQALSPAIDAGVDVGLPYLGTAPDCGYAERE